MDTNQGFRFTHIHPYVASVAVLYLSACSTIPLPQSDSTAPSIELTASLEVGGQRISTRRLTPTSGNQAEQAALCPGDILVLAANGKDTDGGIQSTQIAGQVSGTCGQNLQSFPPITQANIGSAATPGQDVPKQRSTFVNVALTDFRCADGSMPNPLQGEVYAQASNYHGGVRNTGSYEFTYPPIGRSCSNDPCFVPLNATLLGTESESCDAVNGVQVNAHTRRENILAGQCNAFTPKPNATPVQWWCVGPTEPVPAARNPNTTDCPQGSNFIKVQRDIAGSHFTIECYSKP